MTGERKAVSARLVIGYGNTLRTDDGIGPAVAELVRARVPSIRCLAIPMLTPELAPQVADAACVVFIDARVGGEPGRLRVSRVRAGGDLAARGESLAAFDGRCILADGVAPPSNMLNILSRRALPARRLARLGATPDFHHGLLGPFGHLLSAGTLVALARGLYGRSAEAFQVSVDAGCLDVGAEMTPPVAAAVHRAADLVSALLES